MFLPGTIREVTPLPDKMVRVKIDMDHGTLESVTVAAPDPDDARPRVGDNVDVHFVDHTPGPVGIVVKPRS
jgi:hypothetical protein